MATLNIMAMPAGHCGAGSNITAIHNLKLRCNSNIQILQVQILTNWLAGKLADSVLWAWLLIRMGRRNGQLAAESIGRT